MRRRHPPSPTGILLARELRSRLGDLGVIILSGYEQDVQLHVNRVLRQLSRANEVMRPSSTFNAAIDEF